MPQASGLSFMMELAPRRFYEEGGASSIVLFLLLVSIPSIRTFRHRVVRWIPNFWAQRP